VRVTSTSRTGSQKLMGIPGNSPNGGRLHRHIGLRDVERLGFPATTSIPATFIGKMHFQQISVIGLTNRPTHFELAGKQVKNIKKKMDMKKDFAISITLG